ncbi:hypothetical protein DCC39_12930 [Pueribacillus theae]|uniref:YtxH domain-containing protein n=1 Tax=Pueribacillus theae TaxID=2171751 RepID=A0A2U1JWV9_9BACI|nr:YtxH domain-containing protein [Pueribacillus theae]PWA09475.1 hypothetical protein DCC39_12930 [Pueribacillus theae]
MSDNNLKSKDFLTGVIVGSIVGAVSALLLAPKSGKEMRSDLNEQASVMKERSLQLKDTAVEKGTEWISVAKEKSSDIAKTVSDQSSQVASKVKDITGQIKSNMDSGSSPLTSENPFLEDSNESIVSTNTTATPTDDVSKMDE